MEPLFELAVALPPKGSRERLRSLHRQLRAAIADGRLQPGVQLPATRVLAKQLGVSRNTVVAAYDLLGSEGYLIGRGGSGSYVAQARMRSVPKSSARRPGPDRRIVAYWRNLPVAGDPTLSRAWRYDFRTGVPDLAQFPFDIWQRLSTRAARALAKERALHEEPQGRVALRAAITRHVSLARAVACHSDDIVVTSGTRQSLDLLARILVRPGETEVAVEDPVYTPVRQAFEAAGARIAAVPVDAHGLVVERLSPNARIICVSPSHQFPLGVALSARRRAQLLDFAQRCGAVIIEDDYDSEFRLEGPPLDALQSLDRAETVFYVGTFSKSLFPALRLGFVVPPPWARQALIAAKKLAGPCPLLSQDTLAAFIVEGHLRHHIRRMRRLYGQRHAALMEALARHCNGRLQPIPTAAGVHLAARLAGPRDAAGIAASAAGAGMRIETLDRYSHRRSAPPGFVFGFGMVEADDMDPAIRRLGRLLC
jgi:GntR family transcriptional regulator/MocR family aminotransferase